MTTATIAWCADCGRRATGYRFSNHLIENHSTEQSTHQTLPRKEAKETQPMSDTLQEGEDQMSEHQVNRSGVCEIPGCPCRGWSAEETVSAKETTMTTEERIKQIPACIECGAVQFARYGHFPECSQFIADLDKVKSDQPAARGRGEEWRTAGQVVPDCEYTIVGMTVIHKCASSELVALTRDKQVAAQIVDEHRQHQALVAERERLRAFVQTFADKGCVLQGATCLQRDLEHLCTRCQASALLNE